MKRVLASLAAALIALGPLAFVHAHTASADAPYTYRNACPTVVAPGFLTCYAIERISATPADPSAPGFPSGYHPADLLSAYNLQAASAGGSGQTLADVIWFDDPNAESDVNHYRAQFGLPACTSASGCFKKVNEYGGSKKYPRADANASVEISLDLDMYSAICPKCKIILVEAWNSDNKDLYIAENEAAKLGATAISNSWGGPEFSQQTIMDKAFNHPGIMITVSTGDSGYGVSYPATSQYVTAVGGTSLYHRPSGTRNWTETAWSGAGSGCSRFDAKPSWQTDPLCARRTDADVSAVADPNTGVAFYDTYQNPGWGVVGGTSVSAPLIAGVYALAGNGASLTYGSYSYSHTSSLYDITKGSNGSCGGSYLCTAGPGYDGPTGNGTPNGTGAF